MVWVNSSGSQKKTAVSLVALHVNVSAPVRVADLVEVSKDVASLIVCTQKNFWLGCGFFVSDVISGGLFGHPGQLHLALGRQPLDGSILLKLLLETRLQSESFDTLDDLLGFRVQKL